ncbi:hypothetical protein JK359_16200 [Streptomyces actinomycinicus]|uniref:Uncharacterized protein n=1 Tax=Streptomyces actinomycinicus TaxID=1695166 RepID=A0A937EIK2_9ACTN|nr:hypothetical protein [Streptomyces actinomycinicus]MBL1083496.1 hypothetical protein [Streptomyces actinomycinicus]
MPDSGLNGLVTVSADEAWAVGRTGKPPRRRGSLLHYAAGRWNPVPLPVELRDDPELKAAASAPHDVWIYHREPTPLPPAAGEASRPYPSPAEASGQPDGLPPRPAMRWDGKRWHRIPAPFPITALRVLSPRNAWAVDPEGALRHWDGRRWQRNRLPVQVRDVDASSPDDVWAVGIRMPLAQFAAMHFDGHSWQRTRLPEHRFTHDGTLPGETSSLGYVRVLAADDVWATGAHTWEPDDEAPTDPPFEKYLLHWDGQRWTSAAYPPRAAHDAPIQPMAPDGSGGLVLGAWLRRTPTGRYLGIDAPPRVEGWTNTEVKPSKRRWLSLSDLAEAPGTHTLFGVGALTDGTTDRTSRAVIVRYQPSEPPVHRVH